MSKKRADLSPPLGYPGGSCYLQNRIEENVRNPRMREQVLDVHMSGADKKPGRHEEVIYDPLDEGPVKGTSIERLVIGEHAQYRMDQKGVTLPEIKAALRGFQQVWNKERSQGVRTLSEHLQNPNKEFGFKYDDLQLFLRPLRRWDGVSKIQLYLRTVYRPGIDTPNPAPPDACGIQNKKDHFFSREYPEHGFNRLFPKQAQVPPGVKTFVDVPSTLNLPPEMGRETEVVLPPGSATPGSGGRIIPQPSYTTPGESTGMKPRTIGVPGDMYGHPTKYDYGMPTRRSMAAAVVQAYLQKNADGRGCEDAHSWAWISPNGDFIEVDDHSGFALSILTPEEIAAEMLYGPTRAVFKKTPMVLHKILVEACVADPETFVMNPPPGLQKGLVYSIPLDVQKAAERLGFPNLSKGSWSLKTRLTPAENRYLVSQGVVPEVVKVDVSNRWNARLMEAWSHRHEYLRQMSFAAISLLLRKGWAKVANAYAVGADVPSDVKWDSFFAAVLKCWKAQKIRPDLEKEVFEVVQKQNVTQMSYADAVGRFASQKMQEEFFEYALSGPRATSLFEQRLTDRGSEFYIPPERQEAVKREEEEAQRQYDLEREAENQKRLEAYRRREQVRQWKEQQKLKEMNRRKEQRPNRYPVRPQRRASSPLVSQPAYEGDFLEQVVAQYVRNSS